MLWGEVTTLSKKDGFVQENHVSIAHVYVHAGQFNVLLCGMHRIEAVSARPVMVDISKPHRELMDATLEPPVCYVG